METLTKMTIGVLHFYRFFLTLMVVYLIHENLFDHVVFQGLIVDR